MLSRHLHEQSPDKPAAAPRLRGIAQRPDNEKGAQLALAPAYRVRRMGDDYCSRDSICSGMELA